MLVYPSYQYITTRQDDSGSNSGFFETIQNYFINFGNGQTQSDDSNQIMDAVEADKPQAATTATDSTKSVFNPEIISQEKNTPTPTESKQKFFYSYETPASTVPLNADRRLFYLAEQPQVFGTFSGTPINPVFNLQQVPVVLSSRSNVAQPDDSHPNKVISENVQKFSQIPPVMATIEQTQQVEGKSSINVNAQTDSVFVPENRVVDAVPENRVVPVFQPVEDNRALPVSTERTIVADVVPAVDDVVSSVVVARTNPVPLTVSSESVSSSVVASSVVPSQVGVVGSVVEGNESVQTVVSPSLKEVEPAVVPPVVVSSVVADQTVQGSQSVESVTGSV